MIHEGHQVKRCTEPNRRSIERCAPRQIQKCTFVPEIYLYGKVDRTHILPWVSNWEEWPQICDPPRRLEFSTTSFPWAQHDTTVYPHVYLPRHSMYLAPNIPEFNVDKPNTVFPESYMYVYGPLIEAERFFPAECTPEYPVSKTYDFRSSRSDYEIRGLVGARRGSSTTLFEMSFSLHLLAQRDNFFVDAPWHVHQWSTCCEGGDHEFDRWPQECIETAPGFGGIMPLPPDYDPEYGPVAALYYTQEEIHEAARAASVWSIGNINIQVLLHYRPSDEEMCTWMDTGVPQEIWENNTTYVTYSFTAQTERLDQSGWRGNYVGGGTPDTFVDMAFTQPQGIVNSWSKGYSDHHNEYWFNSPWSENEVSAWNFTCDDNAPWPCKNGGQSDEGWMYNPNMGYEGWAGNKAMFYIQTRSW